MQKEISVKLSDFIYELPNEKIAFEGTSKRDNSKLLHFHKGRIEDRHFHQITDLLPDNSTLVFNNTKVIPARIKINKETGASIEIFLLKPAYNVEISQSLEASQKVAWKCMIGNLKKWKENELLTKEIKSSEGALGLSIKLINKDEKIVEFQWDNERISFAELIEMLGNTPLPPYIKREIKNEDQERYQTVYSVVNGAVAAPTAGLHFTKSILTQLSTKNIEQAHLTLHVGAGTFMPIKAESVEEHPMHNETMIVPIETLEKLLVSEFTIPVGTTSMRTLESLYWYGVKLLNDPIANFKIDKLYPYAIHSNLPTKQEAIEEVLAYAKRNDLKRIEGSTEIFIFPGYQFRVCQGLITNFHQPESTLILLVAAFIGNKWQEIYNHALKNNYRFLSFGDSSLLIPNKNSISPI